MWVRLRRDVNTFNAFVSSNGVDWTGVAATNVGLPRSLLLGTAATAHNNVAGLASTGRFSNFSITQPVADLSISQVAPSSVYVGGNVTYTITVRNGGPDATWNNVTVTIPIPAGSTYVSATPNPAGGCSLNGSVVTCDFGPMIGDATITLVTTMNVVGTTTNTATVSSTAVDPVSANNSSSVQVRVLPLPVMSNVTYNANAGTFSVSVPTANGFSYHLEYKDHLTDAAWTALPAVPGNGSTQTLSDPGPLPPTRFYRVTAE